MEPDRVEPIMFVHGIDIDPVWTEGSPWGEFRWKLEEWGWTGPNVEWGYYECDNENIHGFKYYGEMIDHHPLHSGHPHSTPDVDDGGGNHDGDANCGGVPSDTAHDPDTSIRHLGVHWAWAVYDHYWNPNGDLEVPAPTCVKAVGHSMGGLIIRYAIQHIGDPGFPPSLCVSDVVTLGTPHDGALERYSMCGWTQCNEMNHGSGFLRGLGADQNPQTAPGDTDWTVMGSFGDDSVGAYNAVHNIQAPHEILFRENVDHMGTAGWKDHHTRDWQADVEVGEGGMPRRLALDAPMVTYFTHLSLKHKTWGCGTDHVESEYIHMSEELWYEPVAYGAWPLPIDLEMTGEPHDAWEDCWYRIEVGPGTAALQVDVLRPGFMPRMSVHAGSPTGPEVCTTAGSKLPQGSCTVAQPALGLYFVRVESQGSMQPFTIKATTSPTDERIVGIQWTQVPTEAFPGTDVEVCWKVMGRGRVLHTAVHGFPANDPSDEWETPAQTGALAMEMEFCDRFQMPSPESGGVLLRAHAAGPNEELYAEEAFVAVAAPDDCGSDGDAGDWAGMALRIDPTPSVGCDGALLGMGWPDWEDWYVFDVLAEGTKLSIEFSQTAGEPDAGFSVCIHDHELREVVCASGVGGAQSASALTDAGGDWYLRVTAFAPPGSYNFTLQAKPMHNDCDSGGDAPMIASGGLEVEPPVPCHGSVQPDNQLDGYRFRVPHVGMTLHAEFSFSSEEGALPLDLCLYDLASSIPQGCAKPSGADSKTLSLPIPTEGDWGLQVEAHAGESEYDLFIQLLDSVLDDCGTHDDVKNAPPGHPMVPDPATGYKDCAGDLHVTSDEDWYYVETDPGQVLTVTFTPAKGAPAYSVCLNPPEGAPGPAPECRAVRFNTPETFGPFHPTHQGRWDIGVLGPGSTQRYLLQVHVDTPDGQDDCGSQRDASGWDPHHLGEPPIDCVGVLWDGSDDTYTFTLAQPETQLTILLDDLWDADAYVLVTGPDGKTYGGDGWGVEHDFVVIPATSSPPPEVAMAGEWKVEVLRHEGFGTYRLRAMVGEYDCGQVGDAPDDSWASRDAGELDVDCVGTLPLRVPDPHQAAQARDPGDSYRFWAPEGQIVTVTVSSPPEDGDFDFCLHQDNGDPLWPYWCSQAGGAVPETVRYQTDGAGYWVVVVTHKSGSHLYRLQASGEDANDCGLGHDASGSMHTPDARQAGDTPCAGTIPIGDYYDHYAATGTIAGGDLIVTLEADEGAGFYFCILDPSGNEYPCEEVESGDSATVARTNVGQSPGWRVRINMNGAFGGYRLTIQTPGPQNDCGTGRDAGDQVAAADWPIFQPSLHYGTNQCSGQLRPGDRGDWFKVSLQAREGLKATMTPAPGADFRVCILRPDTGIIACGNQPAGQAETVEVAPGLTSTAAGVYYITVVPVSGSGAYGLQVVYTAAPALPQNDCNSGSDAEASSPSLVLETTCSGELPATTTDEDWYDFYVHGASSFTIQVQNSGGAVSYCLSGAGHGAICGSANSGQAVQVAKDGWCDWGIRLFGDATTTSAGATYTVTLAVQDAPPGGESCGGGDCDPESDGHYFCEEIPLDFRYLGGFGAVGEYCGPNAADHVYLPFSFEFYGQVRRDVWIHANGGYITFANEQPCQGLPGLGVAGYAGPIYIAPSGSGRGFAYSVQGVVGDRVAVFEWSGVFPGDESGQNVWMGDYAVTFEILLYERNNEIEVHILEGKTGLYGTAQTRYTGIQGPDSSLWYIDGDQFQSGPFDASGLAVRFTPLA
ncbi:MAG TPA: hypothetical protein VI796_05270 [Candidatus Thermoplasmatota archaeon]|nr:hypothetical protein [Candidatus Thermoplasmatota archaeon]